MLDILAVLKIRTAYQPSCRTLFLNLKERLMHCRFFSLSVSSLPLLRLPCLKSRPSSSSRVSCQQRRIGELVTRMNERFAGRISSFSLRALTGSPETRSPKPRLQSLTGPAVESCSRLTSTKVRGSELAPGHNYTTRFSLELLGRDGKPYEVVVGSGVIDLVVPVSTPDSREDRWIETPLA